MSGLTGPSDNRLDGLLLLVGRPASLQHLGYKRRISALAPSSASTGATYPLASPVPLMEAGIETTVRDCGWIARLIEARELKPNRPKRYKV